jgi:hypothetical protein
MTDLQQRILDKLNDASIGVDWPDGPLTLAARVVGGRKRIQFGQTDNDRGAKSEIARRLGYPVLLCEAIQGANRGLKDENDRRRLATTLFGTLGFGGAIPKLSSQEQNRIALRMVIRTHPYVCHPDCAVPAALADLLASHAITGAMARKAAGTQCETALSLSGRGPLNRNAAAWLTDRSTPAQRLLQSAVMALRGFESGKSVHGWCSLRESARLAASERGLAEAVDCCCEIACQCRDCSAFLQPDWLQWNDGVVIRLSQAIKEGAHDHLPILGDALEEAGCDNETILAHCRRFGENRRSSWVVALVLGAEQES